MPFRFPELVGRYRLVVSAELLAFVERTFVEPAPEPERSRIRQEAWAEASAAELWIEPDGTVVSRAGTQEFYRIRLTIPEGLVDELVFDKAPGQSVRLSLRTADTVIALQAAKPPALFARQPGGQAPPR